ncbi:hypothetical protein [Streptomyces sp. CB01881]|uniref:hypothetical protein n=1 Tax=Streptomyces sp. CB01881 TaxID=2078691 RepID=UPI000CDBB7B8|nr:hypothetical protein [Streptomyces sp. CB01881]AUY48869.1 hypothetical protein C2142_07815 [Streptomyces sp. CB01881]TYC77358.1 hypothetical protein EH183_07825 [Streptomyces sp. CB01881]
MRPTRTAAAALIGATVLTGLTAPIALAKDGAATVSPSQAAPGQTVTVTVSCEKSDKPDGKTITANSQAFEGGPATLTLGSDGKHTGSARLAGKYSGDNKVDGTCPDGAAFSTSVTVTTVSASTTDSSPAGSLGEWGQAAGEWAGSLGQSGAGSQQIAPHGAVKTGLGGSVASNPAELAGGAALVVGGIGGFWLLRRRTGAGSA